MGSTVLGQFVDIRGRRIFPASVSLVDGLIDRVEEVSSAPGQYILPGFIDAHIHIESSMLVPYEFARMALRHGTVATVSDPHEIANVLGVEGVRYMIENSKGAKLKFHFGAPSCVPATSFETAGAELTVDDVSKLLHSDDIYYLSEMMNYPGVLNRDPGVMSKIQLAHEIGKPVDGHAPGLTGSDAQSYIDAGISTDHECFTLIEALDKLERGMKILIREGSAARNFEALHPLIKSYSSQLMFCSDDKHPDDLVNGHINELVRKSIQLGYDLFQVLEMACLNPVEHYKLNVGQLHVGDSGDFIIVKDLKQFEIVATYIDGEEVANSKSSYLPPRKISIVNKWGVTKKKIADFQIQLEDEKSEAIQALDGEIVTDRYPFAKADIKEGQVNLDKDLLKICVVNRYSDLPVAVGHIRGFGLHSGAIASSVAHDSHNIVVVGADDESIVNAVNLIIEEEGGLSCAINGNEGHILPLPIAGLMSNQTCEDVATAYSLLDRKAKESLGCQLRAPFMTLSFMALLVIPKLKMSDLGMFDAESFAFV